MKALSIVIIKCCIAFLSLAQSEYHPIKFTKDYTYGEKPVIDSILINGDLTGFIQDNVPSLVGEQILIRTVLLECDNNEYFRVYDCIILKSQDLKSELIQFSDWLSEKEILIFINPSIAKTYIEKKTTKCSFTLEWGDVPD